MFSLAPSGGHAHDRERLAEIGPRPVSNPSLPPKGARTGNIELSSLLHYPSPVTVLIKLVLRGLLLGESFSVHPQDTTAFAEGLTYDIRR